MHIYVAGPYTASGPLSRARAIRQACEAGALLDDAGHIPFVPHVAGGWAGDDERFYGRIMAWCLAWVARCDALLRIPGESPGADREVEHARKLGLPVFYCLSDIPDPE